MITNEEMITDEERQCILGACLISAGTAIYNDLQTRNPDNLYVGPYDSINVENLATKFFDDYHYCCMVLLGSKKQITGWDDNTKELLTSEIANNIDLLSGGVVELYKQYFSDTNKTMRRPVQYMATTLINAKENAKKTIQGILRGKDETLSENNLVK